MPNKNAPIYPNKPKRVIEQKIRAFLFYLSVFIFLSGLPLILSFALGYKFNKRTFKFTKTGLIFIKTQPPGANIYLDNKLLAQSSPATVHDLLPGTYEIRLELAKHYSWSAEVKVEPRKATLLDKIILFPLRPNVKKVNKGKLNYSWVDEEKRVIYYISYEDDSIYTSDMEGGRLEKQADFIVINPPALKWKTSYDRTKILYFNRYQVGITYLASNKELNGYPFIINYRTSPIVDVFWYSDNYHFIIISDKSVEIMEAGPDSKPIELVALNKKNTFAFYDIHDDAVYFTDSQKASDGQIYDNLYKLELNTKSFLFQDLMKRDSDE